MSLKQDEIDAQARELIQGLARCVGDNAAGFTQLLKLRDGVERASVVSAGHARYLSDVRLERIQRRRTAVGPGLQVRNIRRRRLPASHGFSYPR
jgi:hypothetical protein